jgi:hypothetical protein
MSGSPTITALRLHRCRPAHRLPAVGPHLAGVCCALATPSTGDDCIPAIPLCDAKRCVRLVIPPECDRMVHSRRLRRTLAGGDLDQSAAAVLDRSVPSRWRSRMTIKLTALLAGVAALAPTGAHVARDAKPPIKIGLLEDQSGEIAYTPAGARRNSRSRINKAGGSWAAAEPIAYDPQFDNSNSRNHPPAARARQGRRSVRWRHQRLARPCGPSSTTPTCSTSTPTVRGCSLRRNMIGTAGRPTAVLDADPVDDGEVRQGSTSSPPTRTLGQIPSVDVQAGHRQWRPDRGQELIPSASRPTIQNIQKA